MSDQKNSISVNAINKIEEGVIACVAAESMIHSRVSIVAVAAAAATAPSYTIIQEAVTLSFLLSLKKQRRVFAYVFSRTILVFSLLLPPRICVNKLGAGRINSPPLRLPSLYRSPRSH